MNASASQPRRFDHDVDGILLLDKPLGMSSNHALQAARRIFRAIKAGHTGSLDPLASGMLPICFGEATKVCGFMLDAAKRYRFTVKLGSRTATGDAEGEVVERQPAPELSDAALTEVLTGFLGETEQVPPMYSALKHQGERLYRIARRGESVERAKRRVRIESLRLVEFDATSFTADVKCSKGTYVRTLAEDIAARLGTVGHLTMLRRTEVEPFTTEPMYTLEALQALDADSARLQALLLPADRALPHWSSVTLDARQVHALLHGQAVASAGPMGESVRLYSPDGRFLGLGERTQPNRIQPRRLFTQPAD